jgi:PDZ domain-containing protein
MTSVRYTRLTGFDMLLAWLDPDRAVVAPFGLYPDGEDVQVEQERSISQMDSSKLDASAVVLRALEGYPKNHGDGVLIESVVSGCAADGELFPGDRILSIDGRAGRQLPRRESGDRGGAVGFLAHRSTCRSTAIPRPSTWCASRAATAGIPLVGVRMINSFPVPGEHLERRDRRPLGRPDVGARPVRPADPGDLTDGRTIAGTGQIALDGTVFPIDGIEEKLSAAADAGASVFLVPQGNMHAARASGGHGLELVPVATFDGALAYLHGR